MLLDGKVVMVTGAGRGLGRGIARAIAEEGGRAVVTDLRLEDAEETASVLPAGSALALALNVADAASIAAGIDRAVEAFGPIDGWVNNAGVITMRPSIEVEPAEWSRHFEVNVGGLFECCRLFARHVASRSGAIVNIASNAGKVGYPNMAAYNASKAAVINLTRTLAAEWAASGINVNAVCPGGVETPMLRSVAEWIGARIGADVDQLYTTMTPHQLGRHVQPIEVGRVVAFLLSDSAQIIRGQSINVDGGDTPY